jgi:hypothetical protein
VLHRAKVLSQSAREGSLLCSWPFSDFHRVGRLFPSGLTFEIWFELVALSMEASPLSSRTPTVWFAAGPCGAAEREGLILN